MVIGDICCLTDWHTLVEVGGLMGHGIYYYVPDLITHFTTSQMNALIAARSSVSGRQSRPSRAAHGSRQGRCRVEEGLRVSGQIRKLAAAALRRGPPGSTRDARGNPQVVRHEVARY
jgi:hypothetical protein